MTTMNTEHQTVIREMIDELAETVAELQEDIRHHLGQRPALPP